MDFRYFIYILMIQAFYGFGITALGYGLAPFYDNMYVMGQFENKTMNINDISDKIDTTVSNQINIPLYDLGALVFYSGNILLDLMINFIFAVPSMFTILISAFSIPFMLDAYLMSQVKLFIYTLMSILYLMSLLVFILNIRSQKGVI